LELPFPLLLLVFVFEVLFELLPDAVPLVRFVALPPVAGPLDVVPLKVADPPVTVPPVVLPLAAPPPVEFPPAAAPATWTLVPAPPVPPVAPCVTVLLPVAASPAI
jgi:hypothetical protein